MLSDVFRVPFTRLLCITIKLMHSNARWAAHEYQWACELFSEIIKHMTLPKAWIIVSKSWFLYFRNCPPLEAEYWAWWTFDRIWHSPSVLRHSRSREHSPCAPRGAEHRQRNKPFGSHYKKSWRNIGYILFSFLSSFLSHTNPFFSEDIQTQIIYEKLWGKQKGSCNKSHLKLTDDAPPQKTPASWCQKGSVSARPWSIGSENSCIFNKSVLNLISMSSALYQ